MNDRVATVALGGVVVLGGIVLAVQLLTEAVVRGWL
jgi:hypothetical protein